MKVKLTNDNGDMEFECQELKQEFGFLVFRENDDEEIFVSPAKISMMKVTGRPKEKIKTTKKSI